MIKLPRTRLSAKPVVDGWEHRDRLKLAQLVDQRAYKTKHKHTGRDCDICQAEFAEQRKRAAEFLDERAVFDISHT